VSVADFTILSGNIVLFYSERKSRYEKIIPIFAKDKQDELHDNIEAQPSLPECYPYFVHHFTL
jgi:hypothetical protein